MKHARSPKQITDYNSFKIFEDIYSGGKNGSAYSSDYDELDMPYEQKSSGFLSFLFILVLIIAVGFSLHPLLSYFLKTPYPLVVISEDSMSPLLNQNDLVFIKGVIVKSNINIGDLIVYRKLDSRGTKDILIRRLVMVNSTTAKVEEEKTGEQSTINLNQIVGRVIGNNQPAKIANLGKIALNWR